MKTRPYRTACGYICSSTSGPRLFAAVLGQSRQINAHCASGLHVLISVIVEQQADGQPDLTRLLDEATAPARPFDIIVVASRARLSNDSARVAEIEARLAAADVALVFADEGGRRPSPMMPLERL